MHGPLPTLVSALALALSMGACGSEDPVTGDEPDPNDKRAVALDCFTNEAGLEAQLVGEQSILVGGPTGPRVEFFLTVGEAESQQFKGEAQAAEQLGSTLLFVNDGSDEVLEKLEDCLS